MQMIRAFAGQVPVLGVCLGHQSIVEVFGGKVVRAGRLMHGKTSLVEHDGRTVFAGLPQPCEVGRYHSLIAAPAEMPAELEVNARTAEGEIMGVRHRSLVVEGVQFHPESILTPEGPQLLRNFLALAPGERRTEASSRSPACRLCVKFSSACCRGRNLSEAESGGRAHAPDGPGYCARACRRGARRAAQQRRGRG